MARFRIIRSRISLRWFVLDRYLMKEFGPFTTWEQAGIAAEWLHANHPGPWL